MSLTDKAISRRQLLTDSTRLLAGLSASSILSFPVTTNAAGETKFKSLNKHQIKTITQMSRHMFPHKVLDESYYLAVAQHLDRQATNKKELVKLLGGGISDMDEVTGKAWISLSDSERIRIMKAMEKEAFFALIQNTCIDVLYRHPDVWKLVGYEGSSFEHGGYLHRGFNDIDWLPK